MSGSKFNRKSLSSKFSSINSNRESKRENQCKLFGHTPSKIKAGQNLFCAYCGKRYCAN